MENMTSDQLQLYVTYVYLCHLMCCTMLISTLFFLLHMFMCLCLCTLIVPIINAQYIQCLYHILLGHRPTTQCSN